jgi:type VI secretion system secreted protein Hcp
MKSTNLPRLLAPLVLGAVFLCLLQTPASAALNAYAALVFNGTSIDGETTMNQIGEVDVSNDHVEIHAVNHEAFMAIGSSGQTTGRLNHAPLKFVKRIDKSSPLIQQAMSQNHVVQGAFKFFRNNPDTGVVEHFYTIELQQARISGVRSWSPNNLDAAASTFPFMEEVSIIYNQIRFRHEIAGTEHVIDVNTSL